MAKFLSGMQQRFVEEYLIDLNASAAAKRAGFADSVCKRASSAILGLPAVAKAVKQAKERRSETTGVTAAWVLTRLKQIDELDILDILTDEMDDFRPLTDWPTAWRISICGVDLQHILGSGQEPIEKRVKKIKWPDKVKNLELIGKHVDVQAWREKLEMDVTDRAEALNRARERARSGE